ncbi:hypothetical protein QYS36_13510 [Pseudomonas sp. G34]|uniref:hypothetical protein n=1 Tax=Pseudomonas sp. G34 TaxID=3059083 RepID=UPI00280772CA|nr:hypothetical protein [Pseudomonas sp. G34]MDQ7985956.1 hypothetical protein [Pseudomonas sp. G34]
MPSKQNPFSLYDFLGYLIPGALLIYIAFGLNDLFYQLSYINKLSVFFRSTQGIMPLIIFSYMAGHIIGIVSSYTIENAYVDRYGYPSRQILSSTYKQVKKEKLKLFKESPFTFLSTYLAEKTIRILIRSDIFKAKTLESQLDNITLKKIKHYFIKNHKCDDIESLINSEYFHHIYHYCVENSSAHLSKIQNYVALYGLFRNTAFVALLTAWAFIFETSKNLAVSIYRYKSLPDFSPTYLLLGAASFLCFSILYLGFSKFYRRYTSEVFLAFCITYQYEKNERQSLRAQISGSN